MKVLIWGTGNTAKEVLKNGINGEIVGFVRSKACADGKVSLYEAPIYTPETMTADYDMIFVASIYSDEIYQTICKLDICLEKICFLYLPSGNRVNVRDNYEKGLRFLSQENILWMTDEKRGSSVTDDGRYPVFCQKAAKEDALFERFRSHPVYKLVLEHTSYQVGKQYLDVIFRNQQVHFNDEDWADFCRNDLYGGAELCPFEIKEETLMISPPTLRYVKVMQDIFTLFDKNAIGSVAEIGVGYGGQCRLLTNHIKNLEEYALIDLPEVLLLAKRYLGYFENMEKLKFVDGTSDMELRETYDLLISNYAFSELTRAVQDMYLDKVLSKARSGYITWNSMSINNLDGYRADEIAEKLPGKVKIIPEEPLTCEGNCIIVWGNVR